MNTQVIFNLDKKLKEQAMKKAQNQGLSFGVILKLATKAFVDGDLNVGLISKEEFNPSTRKEIEKALKDIKAGKNLSPKFSSAKEAIAYLKS
jgi:antitoxin component of RelBE/YafQ-DinJ toxin-antitoxin module